MQSRKFLHTLIGRKMDVFLCCGTEEAYHNDCLPLFMVVKGAQPFKVRQFAEHTFILK